MTTEVVSARGLSPMCCRLRRCVSIHHYDRIHDKLRQTQGGRGMHKRSRDDMTPIPFNTSQTIPSSTVSPNTSVLQEDASLMEDD